ncbi:MAG: peptidoglycan DD-metalloendopeptidase family protein [Symploca sp. SIO1C4]|uniref:Peptidoglycan DD-metalloendopeptidase family protein n=1 Tax=Symploca sp. SIO1C4 TaxID=2607765 RepID=A0A6B3NIP2_9CYAN|nr:peptidoglycan DD-metalloendopeptidase family protein [Symploca sp. SIO1C4]
MKRRFTPKVKPVPSCTADSFEALSKHSLGKHLASAAVPSEVERRSCTSAAMIGLAISMGASGLLLPQQSDEAMAVESAVAEPTFTTLPVEQGKSVLLPSAQESPTATSLLPSIPIEPEAKGYPKPDPPSVFEHQVKAGQTLWGISKAYQVKPEVIAASNQLSANAVLPIGQKLKIPSVNGIAVELKAPQNASTLLNSSAVYLSQQQTSASMLTSSQSQTGGSLTVPGKINDLLKARQDFALNRIKEQRQRLNQSLTQLRSEESSNLAKLTKVSSSALADTQPASPKNLHPEVFKPQEKTVVEPQVIKLEYPDKVQLPANSPQSRTKLESVVLPSLFPENSVSLAMAPTTATKANLATLQVITPETATKSQLGQPLAMDKAAEVGQTSSYKVKPGDTVYGISRRYGLSESELIRANELTNPHLITINQKLRIPAVKATSVARETTVLAANIKSQSETLVATKELSGLKLPTTHVSTLPEQVTTVLNKSQLVQSPVRAESSFVLAKQATTTPSAGTKSNQSASFSYNAHVEQLRADILKVRAGYEPETPTAQASKPLNREVPIRSHLLKVRAEYEPETPTAQESELKNVGISNQLATTTESSVNRSTVSRVNPDYGVRSNREALSTNLNRQGQQQLARTRTPVIIELPNAQRLQRESLRRRQADRQGSIEIKVPPPERQVATAPTPAGSYNPMTNVPVGEMVSPELPPLAPPDMYLPDSPTRFNGYIWPTRGVLTSGYGRRWGRMHRGIDIAAPIGTPIMAAAPGVVVSAGWNSGGYGKMVKIKHADGSLTLYAHNNRILVRRGQQVTQGQPISEMGSTGRSTGPHLHFEIHPKGRGAANPMAYLPKR